jgi:hypothetical protein
VVASAGLKAHYVPPLPARSSSWQPVRAADANARLDRPDWRVEEIVCAARSNIAITTGAFADAARLAEQAAGLARAGGDLADTSLELTIAVACHLLVGDAPRAVPLANEALALARQIGAPALIATGLLAVGVAVGDADPGQARACLRESRELSDMLGYHTAIDLVWATAIALLLGDVPATLQLGRQAIRGLPWGGDRMRMGMVLHIIAGALATTRPDAAAIIQGAAGTHAVAPPRSAQLISSIVTGTLGDERTRELRARGADMDWDQALAYTLTQTTQALSELKSGTQPWASCRFKGGHGECSSPSWSGGCARRDTFATSARWPVPYRIGQRPEPAVLRRLPPREPGGHVPLVVGVRGNVAMRRLANPVTFCDGHSVFFVAASGQILMAAETCTR